MHTLTTAVDTTDTTGAFETTMHGKVWLHVASEYGGGVVTMQSSIDQGATWADFYPDGTLETLTNAGTVTITKLYDLPGGLYWRLENDDTAAATTAYVDGPHIRANVYDPNAVDSVP